MTDQATGQVLEEIRSSLAHITTKLEAHDERFSAMDERLDRLEAGQRGLSAGIQRLEAGQLKLQRDVDHIKLSVGQLQAIATDHEHRLTGAQ